jgi:hypothetical protein
VLKGLLTSNDNVTKVINGKLDPNTSKVSDVMVYYILN